MITYCIDNVDADAGCYEMNGNDEIYIENWMS